MHLSRQQAETLANYAIQAAPYEACGLLAGRQDDVSLIIPIANIATDPRHQYELDHTAFVQAMFKIQRQELSLVGIYHSHPSGEPIPSPTDIAQCLYPDVAHVIIGLQSSAPQLAAWNIRGNEVTRVELVTQQQAPPSDTLPLSTAGRVAIVCSTILAVIIALAISLSLLPPAPAIP